MNFQWIFKLWETLVKFLNFSEISKKWIEGSIYKAFYLTTNPLLFAHRILSIIKQIVQTAAAVQHPSSVVQRHLRGTEIAFD